MRNILVLLELFTVFITLAIAGCTLNMSSGGAGADAAAVIRAVASADDVAGAARALVRAMEEARG